MNPGSIIYPVAYKAISFRGGGKQVNPGSIQCPVACTPTRVNEPRTPCFATAPCFATIPCLAAPCPAVAPAPAHTCPPPAPRE